MHRLVYGRLTELRTDDVARVKVDVMHSGLTADYDQQLDYVYSSTHRLNSIVPASEW